jgi:hypothetical protein
MHQNAANGALRRQVFISHTGQDQGTATFAAVVLKEALEKKGLKVYLDIKDLEPGCDWPGDLMQAAANSAVVVVVLSKTYPKRFWCMLELHLALHARERAGLPPPRVIPVFFDHVKDVVTDGRQLEQFWSTKGFLSKLCFGKDSLSKLSQKERDAVDAAAWAANITAMKDEKQHVRLEVLSRKDREGVVADQVAAQALKVVPVLQRQPSTVEFDGQEVELVQRLQSEDGLWLYGMGACARDVNVSAVSDAR